MLGMVCKFLCGDICYRLCTRPLRFPGYANKSFIMFFCIDFLVVGFSYGHPS